MIIFLILSQLLLSIEAKEDAYLNQLIYRFIYNNEAICGDAFREANWLPSMNECTILCEPTQYICLVSTDEHKLQKCRELTDECTVAVRKYLGWPTEYIKIPWTTTSTSTTTQPLSADFLTLKNSIIDEKQHASNTLIKEDPLFILEKELEPISFGDQIPKVLQTTTTLKPSTTTHQYYSERFAQSHAQFNKIEQEQLDAASLANEQKSIPRNPPDTVPQRHVSSIYSGTRIDIVPPLPPPDLAVLSHTNSLRKSTSITDNNDGETPDDYSYRCCEWAINGLCDSSWKKIRKLCPKSCGAVVCEDIEGIRSCERLINVDVEDCFQTLRMERIYEMSEQQTKTVKGKKKLVRKSKRKLKAKKKSRKHRLVK